MEFIAPDLDAYVQAHTGPQKDYLLRLERETHLKTLKPRMLSGAFQGRFLSMLSSMIRPEKILEIGTFTGYSALCLAEGLAPNGVLHTLESNEELEPLVRRYIAEANMEHKIRLHIGDALALLKEIDGPFDLVFIDAAKKEYAAYYDAVFDKVKVGGYLIADNALWSGKILQIKMDADTALMDAFNKKVHADSRVENILLPIRDGLLVMRKIA